MNRGSSPMTRVPPDQTKSDRQPGHGFKQRADEPGLKYLIYVSGSQVLPRNTILVRQRHRLPIDAPPQVS